MNFRKYLPFGVLVLGVILVVVILVARGRAPGDDAALRELSLAERPLTYLVPREDGHWLKLVVDNIKVEDAKTLDYELLYEVPGGVTQGVPGTVPLEGLSKIERDLLLGSESSGKFRYDEGVSKGTINLKFRNTAGRLIAKLSTDFNLQKGARELASIDGKFKYTLNAEPGDDVFFVTMETFGLPAPLNNTRTNPYGSFASTSDPFPGKAFLEGKIMRYEGEWKEAVDGQSTKIGVFVGQ